MHIWNFDEVLQSFSSVNLYQFMLSPAMGSGAISPRCVVRLTNFALTLFWPLVLAAWEILVFLHIFWVGSLPSQQILFSQSLFLTLFFLSLPEEVSVLCNQESELVWCLCCIVHSKTKSRNNMLMCVYVSRSVMRPHGLQPARLLCPWVFQARVLEWFAISFSREYSRPRDQTQVSCTEGRFSTNWTTREVPICLWWFSLFFFFGLCSPACRIIVPQPGMEPVSHPLHCSEVLSTNRQEIPGDSYFHENKNQKQGLPRWPSS